MHSSPDLLTKDCGITDLKQPLSNTFSIFSELIDPVSIKITPSSEGLRY